MSRRERPDTGVDSIVALLGEADLQDESRRHRQLIWRGVADVDRFLAAADLERAIDASLLRWPYFVLLQDGTQVPAGSCTATRDVIGQRKTGFPDPDRIRRHMRAGATLKLNNVGDWHRPTARLESELGLLFACMPTSYVFWTPAGERGMRPHRDAAHVVAIQLAGRKRWQIYADPDQVAGSAGLDVDASRPTDSFELAAGDMLYLPHGWPHSADALDEGSLHLTVTLSPVTPDDLIEAVLAEFKRQHEDLVHRHHARSLPAKAEEVRVALGAVVDELDNAQWLATALAVKQAPT